MTRSLVTLREAVGAALDANRYIQGLRQDPRYALTLLEPYADCEEFVDATPEDTRRGRGVVCLVMADCYHSLGEFRTAAEWYRRAGRSWKQDMYPGFYAATVIDHKLEDYYEDALDWVKYNQDNWQRKPLLLRLFYNVASWRWWIFPSNWRMTLRDKKLIPELESLIQAKRCRA